MSSSIGLSSFFARANASSPHSCQSIGWCAADRKYGLAESFNLFSVFSLTIAPKLAWASRPGRDAPALLRFQRSRFAFLSSNRLLHLISRPQIPGVQRL